jgi:hypothetical protein
LFRQREHRGAPSLERVTFDASLTVSARESLNTMDFESMTTEELAAARAALTRLKLKLPRVRTRRYAPHARGERIDPRASLRASLRLGGATIALKRRSVVRRPPPLVLLCDVSGSMNRYTRMFLHFLHATVNDRDRVHALTFGTRLTSITRHLQYRDPDVALARVSRAVQDWSGGTRIGTCLKEFNNRWSRPAARTGRDRAPGERRSRLRCGRRSFARDGAAREVVPAADLVEPAPSLRWLRTEAGRHTGDAALGRRIPAGAQHRKPGRPRAGACCIRKCENRNHR